MKTEHFAIDRTPAVLYGAPTDRAYLFLHGQLGCKEEAEAFAQVVCPKGYQVLSVDLPGHGARQGREEALVPWTAEKEIRAVVGWAQGRWPSLSLRANSIGAWLAMLALAGKPVDTCLFVSPVVDMENLIQTMMTWAGVTEERLEREREIPTDFGQTLSWDYLKYVRQHPVHALSAHTNILYGDQDNLVPQPVVECFARAEGAHLTVYPGGEHWFHTPEQMKVMGTWEERCLP